MSTKAVVKKSKKVSTQQKSLAHLIRAFREENEIPQVDFAKKLGTSKQHLCDIERGRKSISPKLSVKYAKILGYPKEEFLRLVLQELIDKEGLKVRVTVSSK